MVKNPAKAGFFILRLSLLLFKYVKLIAIYQLMVLRLGLNLQLGCVDYRFIKNKKCRCAACERK